MKLSLNFLNHCAKNEFQQSLAGLVEHSDWVVTAVMLHRPFASRAELLQALMDVITDASPAVQIKLLNVHPELAGQEAMASTMAEASSREQSRLGLTELNVAQFLRLKALNSSYRSRFGYPCVIALRLHDSLETVFDAFQQRLQNSPDVEIAASLQQVRAVVEGRLATLISTDD
jgi:2-oxo-4-hydroxy-4-carboxy-5-ureidoimidazoline decarboxylase